MSKPNHRPLVARLLTGFAAAMLAAGCASTPEAPPSEAPPPPVVEAPAPAQPAPQPAASATAPDTAQPAPVRLNPRHPDRYVVKKGDTLWDISAMFLRDPWFWPEIWYANPQVRNPHLIFPGDVLSLVYMDGRPRIVLERGETVAGAPGGRERLEPRVRAEPLEDAILTIPFDRIAAFLGRPTVLDRETVDRAPYILTDRRGHLAHASNSEVYVRGASFATNDAYSVVHVGVPLRDPDTGRVLGYEGIYVGEGRITREGDPATFSLSATAREALNGDKLVAIEPIPPLDFVPRAPEQQVDGRIIHVLDGLSLISPFQIVTLNRGAQHGLEPGHVLAVWQAGERVSDRFGGGRVQLPDEYAGNLMIFRTYDDLSYGLIMQASHEIRVLDRVRNP
jgi:hypothetical protein